MKNMSLGKKYTFPNLVALRVIPVHMNVQFAGLLRALEEQPKHYAFNTKQKKKSNKKTIQFSLAHTYIQFVAILIIHAVLKRPAPFP